jgi:hypothetical protein
MVKFKNNFCQVPFRERAVDVSQEPDLDSSLKNSWTLKRRILNGEKENAPRPLNQMPTLLTFFPP